MDGSTWSSQLRSPAEVERAVGQLTEALQKEVALP